MADGSSQGGFNFPKRQLVSALRQGEIVVDFFAGGGGASEALKQALGRDPDVAVNHDPWALGMHAANHPFTRHLPADVWTVDILREVAGRFVGWFHASPDCTHFSQAKGGQPRSRATRSLSWVVLKVAGTLAAAGLAPRIISLENVEQILKWGPLVAKRDKATGRVVKLDGTVAAKGERISVWEQCLVPDKKHAGRTWDHFVAALRGLGYVVEWRKLSACDYGAGTSRKRLFLVARRDGMPIVWPAPTHGDAEGLLPFVTAADCIDFTLPCPSIFLSKEEARKLGVKRPLADATLCRVARGTDRYVINAAEPFIVIPTTHQGERRSHPGSEPLPTVTGAHRGELAAVVPTVAPFVAQHAQSSVDTNKAATKPLSTMCAEVKGGHFAVVAPVVVQASHGEGKPGGVQRWGEGVKPGNSRLGVITAGGGDHALAAATLIQAGYGEREGQAPRSLDIEASLGVVTAGGIKHAVVSAFLEQANGGFYDGDGNSAADPISSITGSGSQQRLVTANLATLRRNCDGRGVDEPLGTVCAGAEHHAVVECTLSPEHEEGALRVAAFLMKYHGTGANVPDIDAPLSTISTKDRLALVTVWVKGNPYVIVDIGLRMLRREELFRAQGFPADYIIDRTADGRSLSISKSVRMVGNSVSPPPLRAIAEANLDQVPEDMAVAA